MKIIGRATDSLWYYSQTFDIPLPLIIDSNPHIRPNDNLDAQDVFIPGYVTKEYTINNSDTVESIINKFTTSIEQLELLNTPIDDITNKQTLIVPIKLTKTIVQGQKKYDYQSLMKDINDLLTIYPFIIKNNIGRSVLDKEIPELVIGKGKKRVHMNGSFHGNEWITTAVLMEMVNNYVLSLTNQTEINGINTLPLYYSTTLSLVPMVNPDGVDLVLNGPPNDDYYSEYVIELNKGNLNFDNWKANIRGVDLNNQFPAKWELESPRKPQVPSPRDYPGAKPLTEPESIAMAALTEASDFDRVLAFHTQCKEIYWGFDGQEPPYAEAIAHEFEKVSGYRPIRNLDSYAGYKDWFIYKWGKPGYTLELGEGVNPLPINQFESIYRESIGIFLAALYM